MGDYHVTGKKPTDPLATELGRRLLEGMTEREKRAARRDFSREGEQ